MLLSNRHPIWVDPRAGSDKLLEPIKARASTTVALHRMAFGDISFKGNGPGGEVTIGIEVKTISEMLARMRDHGFTGHQMPGMLNEYQYCWLLLIGETRCSRNGLLEVQKSGGMKGGWWQEPAGPRTMYADFEHFITTIEMRAGFRVKRARDRDDAAAQIVTLYRWWNSKDWHKHTSHLNFDESWIGAEGVSLTDPPINKVVAARLPGVGWVKAGNVARTLPSVEEMIEADYDKWNTIDGIGPLIANKILGLRGWRKR